MNATPYDVLGLLLRSAWGSLDKCACPLLLLRSAGIHTGIGGGVEDGLRVRGVRGPAGAVGKGDGECEVVHAHVVGVFLSCTRCARNREIRK